MMFLREYQRTIRKTVCLFVVLSMFPGILSGCGGDGPLDPKNPVTITLWHTYVEDMRDALDNLISDFNYTVGAEKGVIIKVTSITGRQNSKRASGCGGEQRPRRSRYAGHGGDLSPGSR